MGRRNKDGRGEFLHKSGPVGPSKYSRTEDLSVGKSVVEAAEGPTRENNGNFGFSVDKFLIRFRSRLSDTGVATCCPISGRISETKVPLVGSEATHPWAESSS